MFTYLPPCTLLHFLCVSTCLPLSFLSGHLFFEVVLSHAPFHSEPIMVPPTSDLITPTSDPWSPTSYPLPLTWSNKGIRYSYLLPPTFDLPPLSPD